MLALAVLAGALGLEPQAAQAAPGTPSSFYYYADGQRIPLAVSTEWAAVRFADGDSARQAEALQQAGAPLDASAARRDLLDTGISLVPIAPGTGEDALLQGLSAMRQSAQAVRASPVFLAADTELVLTDEFIASFPRGMSRKQIERLNAPHGVSILSEVPDQPNTFVLQVAPGAERDALAMSNLYEESGEALSAAPNFVMILPPKPTAAAQPQSSGPITTPPDDPLYPDQWALDNTQQYGPWMTSDNDIDAPEAWAVTGGDPSVTIALVDEGVEPTQEDLAANMLPGVDFTGAGSGGAPCAAPCGYYDDGYGTMLAGVAAAVANNATGIAGVCPKCSILPVRIFRTGWSTTVMTVVYGIDWATSNGASVINLSFSAPPFTVITVSINNARTRGRGGKGAVVVSPAGDSGRSPVIYPSSLPSVIAVGALNLCAARKTATTADCDAGQSGWASNYGSALDLMAPGVLIDTTDRMGSYGYDAGNYVNSFSGTPPAAAIVAGVAGLMLSVNPDLTAAQVQAILQKNADNLGPAGKDAQTGFGRVNAYRAVTAAKAMRVLTTITDGASLVDSPYIPGLTASTLDYPGAYLGPVKVASADGKQKRIASKGSTLTVSGNALSYSEMMGLPKAQLATEYWFPWYKNIDPSAMQQLLVVSNADLVYSNKLEFYAAGALLSTYAMTPGESATFAMDIDSGPLRIRSSNSRKFIASVQSRLIQSGAVASFSEMMGLPSQQRATEYYFPYYDNRWPTTVAETLLVGNADLYPANVEVSLAGTVVDTFTLPKGTSVSRSYPLSDGPLRVRTTNARKIVTSIGNTYLGATYSEWMGIPRPKVTHTYYFPHYNDVDPTQVRQTLRLINVDTTDTHIEVWAGSKLLVTYGLPPGWSTIANYPIDAGPIRVHSTNSKKILAFIQTYALSGGTSYTYHELYGLPYSLLSAEYWFPRYDNAALQETLYIGRP